MQKIKIMLDEGAKMPTRAHEYDAGLDLYSREDAVLFRHGSHTFDTGVHVQIPEGDENMRYVGFLKSKSGLNRDFGVQSTGTIDCGYTGSIHVTLYNHGSGMVHIKAGQKITQLVILPIITPELEVVDSLEETERGDRGFGSSGAF